MTAQAERRDVDTLSMRFDQNTCPSCGRRVTAHHYADTGSATELPDGACPELFERRRASVPVEHDRRRPLLLPLDVEQATMLVA